jgi:hypothetical protein
VDIAASKPAEPDVWWHAMEPVDRPDSRADANIAMRANMDARAHVGRIRRSRTGHGKHAGEQEAACHMPETKVHRNPQTSDCLMDHPAKHLNRE